MILLVGLATLLLRVASASAAQSPVGLGTASTFGVLAGSTITNTGPSVVNGDLGLSPGTSVTGFPPGSVNGSTHVADAVAAQAQSDLTTAYNDAASRTPAATVAGDLGGQTLAPGVYKSGSSLGLTGTLTLDAQGDPNAVFIFQAGSTLTTASGSRVSLINGANPCNVVWQIGSSATLGTSTTFVGNILALTSISMNDGVTLTGRALARNGATTLINDTITVGRCAATSSTPPPSTSTPPSTAGKTIQNGAVVLSAVPTSVARIGIGRCLQGSFRAVVTGPSIRRVVFSLGGRVVGRRSSAPFAVLITPGAGVHTISARVTFTSGRSAVTLRVRPRSCAAARRRVGPARAPRRPSGFTG
ncbi:MAG TPA: ice-binding family protein [Solirubrobacteraceae bacterium]|jgi:hypothetical protein|nr:ice-binding family protein [Solirubrobacteraceae bacterium]